MWGRGNKKCNERVYKWISCGDCKVRYIYSKKKWYFLNLKNAQALGEGDEVASGRVSGRVSDSGVCICTAAFPITVMASFGPSTGHAGTSGARRVSSVGYLWAEGRDGEGKVKNSFLLCSRGRWNLAFSTFYSNPLTLLGQTPTNRQQRGVQNGSTSPPPLLTVIL